MDDKLKKSVSILYDMELNNYMMTKSIGEMEQKIAELRKKQPYYAPEKPRISYKRDSSKEIGLVIFCVIYGIISFLALIIAANISGRYDIPYSLYTFLLFNFPLGSVAFFVIGLMVISRLNKKEEARQQAKIDRKYGEECMKKQAEVATLNNNNYNKSLFLFQEKEILVSRLAESRQKLGEFYEMVGIDEKYRNIVPIGYMNEFLRLGIATQLEGADGLYYLIMKELRWDQLHLSLEDLSTKLETVIDNQKAIYYELADINSRCSEMVQLAYQQADMAARRQQTLENIERNTACAAYNTERAAKEATYQNELYWFYNNK